MKTSIFFFVPLPLNNRTRESKMVPRQHSESHTTHAPPKNHDLEGEIHANEFMQVIVHQWAIRQFDPVYGILCHVSQIQDILLTDLPLIGQEIGTEVWFREIVCKVMYAGYVNEGSSAVAHPVTANSWILETLKVLINIRQLACNSCKTHEFKRHYIYFVLAWHPKPYLYTCEHLDRAVILHTSYGWWWLINTRDNLSSPEGNI